METQAPETVVTAPVDAEKLETPVIPTEPVEPVVTPVVDAQDEKVGEAIRKEVERREAKLREKYEQESTAVAQKARDAWIAEQGMTWNGKPITTEAEYKQAEKEDELRKQYQSQQLPESVIQELVEGKNFREQYHESQKQIEQRQKKEADYQAFVEAYPDVKGEDIPQAVWDDVSKGQSLKVAYALHENQTLKQKLAESTKAQEIEQLNQANAASSTGSITGNGAGDKPVLFTKKQVDAMSQSEVNKNYNAIIASMKNPDFYNG